MFSRLKEVVKNNWKKVVVGGVAVQVFVYGAKYATGRFMEYHETKALNLWKKVKRDQHFESMDSTFKSSFLALATNLRETVIQCLDAESLAVQLKTAIAGSLDTGTKLDIWERLKIIGFSRIIVTVYGTSILNVLLRIQLSVIGGYLYIESNESEKKHEWRNVNGIILSNNTAIDTDLQQKYLSLASYLVKSGIRDLCSHVYTHTAAVVGPVGLKQKITITQLEQMFQTIAARVNRDLATADETASLSDTSISPSKYPWKYIFPTDILESHDYFSNTVQKCHPHYEPPDMYERLLSETFDLLDSDDVLGLLGSFERQGISHFCDRVADYVLSDSVPNGIPLAAENAPSPSIHHLIFSEVEIPVAKIIPMLNGLVAQGMQENDPWLTVLSSSGASQILAANVYESFSNTMD